jgi:hypothetical protein
MAHRMKLQIGKLLAAPDHFLSYRFSVHLRMRGPHAEDHERDPGGDGDGGGDVLQAFHLACSKLWPVDTPTNAQHCTPLRAAQDAQQAEMR